MSRRRRPTIEFLCPAEDKGVIAEPVPARLALPDWFRRLPGTDLSQVSATNDGITVKRCMPFLDALSLGWILPLAATVRLEIMDDGKSVTGGWDFDREMVSNHAAFQVAGNPSEPRPPMKFHNDWTIRTPPGWSCLFLPPINRPDDVVQLFGGVVDTDRYRSAVNLPFVATAPDGVYTLKRGTPLVQLVPFRRVDAAIRGSVRAESDDDRAVRAAIKRNILAGDGWYRREARASR
ncbi:MAG: DUF6065 family protein [Acidimicrobiales bacterium]